RPVIERWGRSADPHARLPGCHRRPRRGTQAHQGAVPGRAVTQPELAPEPASDPTVWTTVGQHGQVRQLTQASKLQNVVYEIRGPANAHAARLEAEGHKILKLNIGNPSVYGFEAPEAIVRDV